MDVTWARLKKNVREGSECDRCRCYMIWKFKGTKEQKQKRKAQLAEDNQHPAKRQRYLDEELMPYLELKEARE